MCLIDRHVCLKDTHVCPPSVQRVSGSLKNRTCFVECWIRVGAVSKEHQCLTRTRHGYVTFLEVSVLLSSVSSPVVKPNEECKYEPMMDGISFLHWDEYGYRLYPDQERSSDRIIAFSFGKCCLNRGVLGTTYICQVICVEDQLLIVQSEDTDELKILHLNLPFSYISQNWPVLYVATSKDVMYLAVAGLHGLFLYDIRLKKWRVFGDITQEQKIQCKGLLWLGKIVVVCNCINSSDMSGYCFCD